MSYIGLIGAHRLDKQDSSLGLLQGYRQAQSLLRDEADMHQVKRATGWEMGVDGKWRYEVDDPFHTTLWIEDYIKHHFGEPINLRYCMRDTSLLIAYPELERLRLFALYASERRWAGYFDPSCYGMMICLGSEQSAFELQTEGILLHELQHLIQEVEHFARGGSLSLGYEVYHRLAGEVEARNVCLRHALSQEERRQKLRTETQDVADAEQILRLS